MSGHMAVKEREAVSKPQDCPAFEKCEAPLCPLDPGVGRARWFPDEPICRAEKYQELAWINKQRDIRRKLGRKPDIGFFTISKLRAVTVNRDLLGIDPDGVRASARRPKGRRSSRGEEGKAMGKVILVAVEYEGSPGRVLRKVEDALTALGEADTNIKSIRLFGEQKPRTQSVKPSATKKKATVSTVKAAKAAKTEKAAKGAAKKKTPKPREAKAKQRKSSQAAAGKQGRLKGID